MAEKKDTTKKEAKVEEKKTSSTKAYHISKHPSGKWQIKLAKGSKALKLYDTQAEAIEAAKKIAENQDGYIAVHSKKGKIRKA